MIEFTYSPFNVRFCLNFLSLFCSIFFLLESRLWEDLNVLLLLAHRVNVLAYLKNSTSGPWKKIDCFVFFSVYMRRNISMIELFPESLTSLHLH